MTQQKGLKQSSQDLHLKENTLSENLIEEAGKAEEVIGIPH